MDQQNQSPIDRPNLANPPRISLGLFGGSFNPVHLGHLLVAEAAREELKLHRVIFTPAAMSPFKPGMTLAPAAQRVRLIRLALAGLSHCDVDDQEITRGGISYTIDTVRDYARRYPNASLFYLIGADHIQQLPKWRDADELANLVEFVIIPRPGESMVATPPPFRSRVLRGFPLGLSASQIRERVRNGLSIEFLVPPQVAEAIHNNRLYL